MIREVLVSDDGVTRVVDVFDDDEYLHRAETVLHPDVPDVSPVQDIADALTANPDAFPDDILDLLRARLGLPGPT